MTDPIVYKLISVEDNEIPAENPVLVIYAYPTLQAVIKANVTHWLKPIPLSELMAQKDSEIKLWKETSDILVKDGKRANERIANLEAELSSLKSRVLEIAENSFVKGYSKKIEEILYPFGRPGGYQIPDKDTYINNLKEQLK